MMNIKCSQNPGMCIFRQNAASADSSSSSTISRFNLNSPVVGSACGISFLVPSYQKRLPISTIAFEQLYSMNTNFFLSVSIACCYKMKGPFDSVSLIRIREIALLLSKFSRRRLRKSTSRRCWRVLRRSTESRDQMCLKLWDSILSKFGFPLLIIV